MMPGLRTVLKRLAKTNKLFLGAGVLVVLLLVSSLAFWQLKDNKSQAIIVPTDTCAINNTLTFTCYKAELTNIVKENGSLSAFALLKEQYPKISFVKSQCHQLVHAIGRASLAKYDYDLAQVYTHGDHFCASGYFHGASEQIVRDKGANYIISNAEQACQTFAEKERYSLDHYNCVHGLGHGLMEATNLDVFKAIKVCEAFNDGWELRSCDSGVFMQNIMIPLSPDETDDRTSKYLKSDDPMYPCNVVEEKHQWGCYIIQSSWALAQVSYDYAKVFQMCAQVSNAELRTTCYESIGRDASGLQGYDLQKTITACNQGHTEEADKHCFIGAGKDFAYQFHGDKEAKQLCNSVSGAIAEACRIAVDSYVSQF